jgi:hypothetical protein
MSTVEDSVTLPPTTPCTVVWSQGHPFVLDPAPGRLRWIGFDDRGRPVALTRADLQRRGWSLRPAG